MSQDTLKGVMCRGALSVTGYRRVPPEPLYSHILLGPLLGGKGKVPMTKVIKCVEAHYETLEVPFGRIYHWHQGHAGHEDLIRGSQEDRSGPPGQEPHREALPQERAGLLRWLYSAQKEEQIDNTVAAADRWLVEAPHDEEVRRARDQAIERRPGAPPL